MELKLGFRQEGYLQRHIFNPASQQFLGIYQLALFKEDFEQSQLSSRLKNRFGI
jgi:hypothetical protein